MNFQEMSVNGVTSQYVDMAAYREWVRFKAECVHCGKKRINEPHYYGLAPKDDVSAWWVTETDCGCRSR